MREATGIGVVFNSTLPRFLTSYPDAIDYVELIPDTLWTDRGRGAAGRYVEVPAAVAQVAALAERLPIVGHGIGLSIGSALPLDEEYLGRMRDVIARWGITRFSEHLGFTRVDDGQGADRHIGLGLPLPCDEHVLSWLIARGRRATALLGIPMIFENGVRHTPFIEEDMSEPVFLNRLASETGCGVLLDLHNLYVDCRNNGWQADDYLGQLELSNVREIHVAGGNLIGDVYTDSHAGPSPEAVWTLLHQVAPSCRNLEGITFEFHDSYYPAFGPDVLRAELGRLSEYWRGRAHHVA
jgi:uncharacterized protein (UPF0276 family)